jgi:glutathione peroxidase
MLKLMVLVSVLAVGLAMIGSVQAAEIKSPLDFKMKAIDGKEVDLADYKGKVVLIVNVASECGLTPQYEGLEALYEKHGKEGFVILGFPANEFGKQEPGSDAEISEFCTANYGVKFPMFSKIVVKGDGQHPLYQFLTGKGTNPRFAGDISWNFEKFLVDRQGNVVARFAPRTTPDSTDLTKAIQAEIARKQRTE